MASFHSQISCRILEWPGNEARSLPHYINRPKKFNLTISTHRLDIRQPLGHMTVMWLASYPDLKFSGLIFLVLDWIIKGKLLMVSHLAVHSRKTKCLNSGWDPQSKCLETTHTIGCNSFDISDKLLLLQILWMKYQLHSFEDCTFNLHLTQCIIFQFEGLRLNELVDIYMQLAQIVAN